MSVNKKKFLGIDYGDFSIGLAIFDEETDFAFPYKSIFRAKANILRKSIREIVEIIKLENMTDIIIGFPLNADGTEGERVDKVKNFAQMLENAIKNSDVNVDKIDFMDERLTTVEAKSILAERKIKKSEWKKSIDQIAAELILKDYVREKKCQKKKQTQ